MPRMSGAELARAIRGEVQWNDIPVMLITGKSDPKGAVRAYEAKNLPFKYEGNPNDLLRMREVTFAPPRIDTWVSPGFISAFQRV